jgi:transglutaminase-like putative cysteine protease
MQRINRDFTYKSSSTTLSTKISELLEKRTGVCQDFAHFMVSGLRSLGLAGRYVSGYLATRPAPGKPRLIGDAASHAWAGCWIPGAGWLYLDPTNDRIVDDSHATLAWGRDYGDVPPVKGVIFTEAKESKMEVSVDMAEM